MRLKPYKTAIDHRLNVIRKWRKNPPKEWSEEYLAQNIEACIEQIKYLRAHHISCSDESLQKIQDGIDAEA